jgi:hypothetical protein
MIKKNPAEERMARDEIEYNDELHRYYIEGKAVPSVTEILKLLKSDEDHYFNTKGPHSGSMIPSAFATNMNRAAKFGTLVHNHCDKYAQGYLKLKDIKKLEEKEKLHVFGFLNFLKDYDLKVATLGKEILSEILVYSLHRRFAGRLDTICTDKKDRFILVDLKCTFEIPVTVGPQTAGYASAFEEIFPGLKIYKRYVCQLTGEEGITQYYNSKELNSPIDLSIFQSALAIYQWRKHYGT